MKRRSLAVCGVAMLVLLFAGAGDLLAKKPPKPPPPSDPDPVFAYSEDGRLMVMDADGANQTVVFDSGGDRFDLSVRPDWSPDGTKLVFGYSGGGDGPGIYTINLDGTGLTRLVGTTSNVRGTNPAWSPAPVPGVGGNRHRIAYSDMTVPGWLDLYIVDVDGANRVQITNTPQNYETPATWSPSATRLAVGAWSGPDVYWGLYDFESGTYTISEFEGPLAGLIVGGPIWARTPANEDLVAVGAREVDSSTGDVWILDLSDPANARRLTDTPDVNEGGFCWSPDDSSISLRSQVPGKGKGGKKWTYQYEIMSLSDSSRVKIADVSGNSGAAVWRPSTD